MLNHFMINLRTFLWLATPKLLSSEGGSLITLSTTQKGVPMDSLQKKITSLHKRREKITHEMNILLERRNKELLDILNQVSSPSLDPTILAGGILYVCDQAISNPQLAQQWRERGLKFRRGKTHGKSLQTVAKNNSRT